MTGLNPPIDDMELDALLRALMSTGPEVAPARIAEEALREVARTTQARPLLGPVSSRQRLASVWLSAAAILVAITIGVYVMQPSVGPTPSPSTSPTPGADELIPFSSAAAGYELLIPASWRAVESGFTDSHKWAGPGGSVMVSIGTSIFDGGSVTVCAPPTPDFPRCRVEAFPNSIPFDPETDGVGPLRLDQFMADKCPGGCELTVATTLGGEPAELNRTVVGDLQLTYVATFHHQRPVIVYWSEPVAAADSARTERMRQSFAFLDLLPEGASPTPFLDPTELVPFVSAKRGYEIRIPRFWRDGTDRTGLAAGEVRRRPESSPEVDEFGWGTGFGSRDAPGLRISVGEPDGSVVLCQQFTCSRVVARTLDELEALLPKPVPLVRSLREFVYGELVLAGVAGRWARPGNDNGCLGCPGAVYYAYTIRAGRPVVLAFDWWTISFGRMPSDYIDEIVGSFRLVG